MEDEEFLLKMKRNGSRRNNPQTQSSPKKSKKLYEQEQTHAKGKEKQVDPQFKRKDCYFQGTKKGELDKHITLKHTINMSKQEEKVEQQQEPSPKSLRMRLPCAHAFGALMSTAPYCN